MNNYFVDTHAHISEEYYEDIEDIINKANNKNIKYIINSGCDKKSNIEVLKLCDYEAMYGTLGIHPEFVNDYQKCDLEFITNNLEHKKIVAIGEIGLDYHYDTESKDKQKKLFEEQLKIAQECDLPVVVHSREATQDVIDILKKYNVKGVIHSFSGSLEVAQIFIKMGFLLGINGVITFKNAHIKDVIKEIGLENIILETDSPYLTPHPDRGKRNDPSYVDNIAEFICELKGISKAELSKITNDNIKRMFKKICLD